MNMFLSSIRLLGNEWHTNKPPLNIETESVCVFFLLQEKQYIPSPESITKVLARPLTIAGFFFVFKFFLVACEQSTSSRNCRFLFTEQITANKIERK